MRTSRICFAVLPDERGHLYSAMTLARRLVASGHDVSFAGTADDRAAFQDSDLRYVAIAEDVWPAGTMRAQKTGARSLFGRIGAMYRGMTLFRRFLERIAASPEFLTNPRCDLLICDGL